MSTVSASWERHLLNVDCVRELGGHLLNVDCLSPCDDPHLLIDSQPIPPVFQKWGFETNGTPYTTSLYAAP